MRHLAKITAGLFFLLSCLAAAQAEPAPFTANHLVDLRRVTDLQISPDGKEIAFVVRENDLESNAGFTDIWIMNLGKPPRTARRLTQIETQESQPRWSADGMTLYFLSSRSGSAQIWSLPIDGGEASQVSDLPVSVSNIKLSPGNDRIAFSAAVYPGCVDLSCTAARLAEQQSALETGVAFDRLMVRFWDKWRDGREVHLFAASLGSEGKLSGDIVDLVAPLSGDVPVPPFDGVESYDFSPDGQTIVFSIKLRGDDESWSLDSNLYRVNVDGSGDPVVITGDNPGSDKAPVFSADGKWMAWLTTRSATSWSAQRRVAVMSRADGAVRLLAGQWDYSPNAIRFTRNSKSILAIADDRGQRTLWRISLGRGRPVKLTGQGHISSFAAGRGHAVYVLNSLRAPGDIYRIDLDGRGFGRLTALNGDKLADMKFAEYEQFNFRGAGGNRVYGYAMKPANFAKSGKYPVAMIIHGGPHGSMGNQFHMRWNPQVYAGAGYAVVFIDFHGSTGYGQDFSDAIIGDRGGKPLVDLQLGLEAALDKFRWMDGARVCALGASFGGYMVNWIAGAWPERFRCLVNHDGIFDNRMKYYTSDFNGYLEEAFGGTPFDNPEGHERHNPARLVGEWQTPMLVIHGGRDYRVPDSQGIAAFTALQRRGIPSRFLYFQDENHWVSRPANSLQWHREVIGWLDRWLKNPEDELADQ